MGEFLSEERKATKERTGVKHMEVCGAIWGWHMWIDNAQCRLDHIRLSEGVPHQGHRDQARHLAMPVSGWFN